MKYIYNNIENEPDLITSSIKSRIEANEEVSGEMIVVFYEEIISGIHYDVEISNMTDKSIEYCLWNESTEELDIYFTNELSSEDKIILDDIVNNNIN